MSSSLPGRGAPVKPLATSRAEAGPFASAARKAMNCAGASFGQGRRSAVAASAMSISRWTAWAAGFLRRLELGAQPSDLPVGFLGGAFGVQRHHAGHHLGLRQVGRPAIGGGHGFVQAVMQGAHDGHLAGIVDVALGRSERATFADCGQDVVKRGQGEVGVGGDAGFSVGVQFLGDGGNLGTLHGRGGGKWEGIEAARLVVAWVVTKPEPAAGGDRPLVMNARRQHTEMESIVTRNANEHVIRQNIDRLEHKRAVLARLIVQMNRVNPCSARRSSGRGRRKATSRDGCCHAR